MAEKQQKPENTDHQMLNPRVRDVEIGTRILRTIKIYPLSWRDEMDMMRKIKEEIQNHFNKIPDNQGIDFLNIKKADMDTIKLISLVMDMLETNIDLIIKLVVDNNEYPDTILSDCDNVQVSNIVGIVYEQNFKEPSKNLGGLMTLVQNILVLMRQQQQSSNGIQDTDSNTSMEDRSEMAA
jgi:hypothetical protein